MAKFALILNIFLVIFCIAFCKNVPTSKPKFRPLHYFNSTDEHEKMRIVNGHLAQAGQFPHMAAIIFFIEPYEFFCGGTLIGNQWVLTAAHCASAGVATTVYLGSLNINGNEQGRVVVPVESYVVNSQFDEDALTSDVAVIKLSQSVEYTDRIRAAELPSPNDFVGGGVEVWISGYGATSEADNNGYIDPLSYAPMVTLTPEECTAFYGQFSNDGTLCARGSNKESTCYGDSGGPIVIQDADRFILIGVVSFGSANGCEAGDPTGYMRTAFYRNWISEQTGLKEGGCYGNAQMFCVRQINRTENNEIQRIVNGELASAGQFPHMAVIIFSRGDSRFFCSGSLVSNRWILTAGHCADSGEATTVVLGSLNINENEEGALVVPVESYLLHPQFDGIDNDLALIKLSESVEYTDRIRAVDLPLANDFTDGGVEVWISGYGATSDADNDGSINPLSYAPMVTLTPEECTSYFGHFSSEVLLCARGLSKESPCNGDSGGPIGIQQEDRFVQVGVVSFGSANGCETGAPTGYMRTAYFVDWINEQTGL